MSIFTYLNLTGFFLPVYDTSSLCEDLVGFGYARSKRVSTSLPLLKFFDFNIEGNSINK